MFKFSLSVIKKSYLSNFFQAYIHVSSTTFKIQLTRIKLFTDFILLLIYFTWFSIKKLFPFLELVFLTFADVKRSCQTLIFMKWF